MLIIVPILVVTLHLGTSGCYSTCFTSLSLPYYFSGIIYIMYLSMSRLQLVSHRYGASRVHMNKETNDKYTVIQNGSSQGNCMIPLRLKVSINSGVAPRDKCITQKQSQ